MHPQSVEISNEFASVEIRVEEHGNGMCALVTDRRSGVSRFVDVLALEGLVWAPQSTLATLADPGARVMSEDGDVWDEYA